MNNFTLPGQTFLPNLGSSLVLSVETEFEKYLRDKLMCKKEKNLQVYKSLNNLLKILKNKEANNFIFPRLMLNKSYISGSYGFGTRNDPPNDIDLMLVIDGTGLTPYENNQYLYSSTVEGTGQIANPILNHLNYYGFLNSSNIVELFRDELKDSFPNSEIRKDGQVITVTFSYFDDEGLNFDIVPCFHVIPSNQSDYYYIPIGKGNPYWRKTNPQSDINFNMFLNNYHNGLLNPVIMLIKAWNEEKNYKRLSSYHIHKMCWDIFKPEGEKILSKSCGLYTFFNKAEQCLSLRYRDVYEPSIFIDSYLTDLNRQKSIEAIQKANNTCFSATLAELCGNNVLAIESWKNVFGDKLGGEYRWLQNS